MEKESFSVLPLKPIFVEAPFMQWGLDFIGKFIHHPQLGISGY
jgi:hypothetical protein